MGQPAASSDPQRVVLFTQDDPLVLDGGARLDHVEVAYETWGELDADASTLAYDSSGNRLWASTWGLPDSEERFEAMALDEEKHADWFESQIEAMMRIGLPQYLAQQMDTSAAP